MRDIGKHLMTKRPFLPGEARHSLAIVSGRNTLSRQERIKLDVQYMEHWSLWMDLWILLKTLWVVLIKREGLYGESGINDPFVRPPSNSSNGASSELKHA